MASATGNHQAPNKPSGRHTQHPNPKRPKAATSQAGGRNKNCRWRQPPVITNQQTSPAGDTLNTQTPKGQRPPRVRPEAETRNAGGVSHRQSSSTKQAQRATHSTPKPQKAAATNQAGGRNKNCRWRQPPAIINHQTSPAGDTLDTQTPKGQSPQRIRPEAETRNAGGVSHRQSSSTKQAQRATHSYPPLSSICVGLS